MPRQTKDEIKAELDERDISYEPDALKSDLKKLLSEAELNEIDEEPDEEDDESPVTPNEAPEPELPESEKTKGKTPRSYAAYGECFPVDPDPEGIGTFEYGVLEVEKGVFRVCDRRDHWISDEVEQDVANSIRNEQNRQYKRNHAGLSKDQRNELINITL